MRVLPSFAFIFVLSLVGIVLGDESAKSKAVPDGYELVFEEDFSEDSSTARFAFASRENWKRVKVGDRFALEHTDAGGKYKPPHRSPHNIALVATHRFGSFVLDYEAQQTGREYGHRDACVFFNFVDPTHFYYTHIATNSDPHAHQIFTVNEAPRTAITTKGTKGFDWGKPDSWHHVRVVRDLEAGSIEVYVDDMSKPIMVAKDKSHGMGFIGFGSFDDTGRVTNIRIHAPDAVEASPEFFAQK